MKVVDYVASLRPPDRYAHLTPGHVRERESECGRWVESIFATESAVTIDEFSVFSIPLRKAKRR